MDNYNGQGVGLNEHDYESYIITIKRKGDAKPYKQLPVKHLEPACPIPSATFVSNKTTSPQADCKVQEMPSGIGRPITSPLPGVIIDVKVNVGKKVKMGQVVAILEAMKMENEIQSEYDGTVTSVNVSKEDNILEGTTIITVG